MFYNALSEEVIKYDNAIFALRICRDGLIMLRIHELEKQRQELKNVENKHKIITSHEEILSKYLLYLNAIQLLLDSAMMKVNHNAYFATTKLTYNDVITIGRPYLHSNNPNVINRYYLEGRLLSAYLEQPEEDPRIWTRQQISLLVFRTMFEDFNKIVNNRDWIKILNLANASRSEFKGLNYDNCIIQSWFAIEWFLNLYWDKFLSIKDNVNHDRKKLSKESDYTASIISNFLEFNNLIDYKIFKKIEHVRKKRNKIAHELEDKLSLTDCNQAFSVLQYFIDNNFGITIEFNTISTANLLLE